MAITNLAKTKWNFNATPTLSDLGTFAVNFNSNNTDYTSLTVSASQIKYGSDVAYGDSVSLYPRKGDYISLNITGIASNYNVIKANGSVVEVVGTTPVGSSMAFGSSQIYAGSDVDTYLNETWYNTLTAEAKAAIVDKTFRQDSWYIDTTGNPVYQAISGTMTTRNYQISLGSAVFGSEITRHVYIVSVQDIIDFLKVTPEMTSENTTLTRDGIKSMLFPVGSIPAQYYWFRSAYAGNSNSAMALIAYGTGTLPGTITYTATEGSRVIAPVFQIDLSKIDYEFVF